MNATDTNLRNSLEQLLALVKEARADEEVDSSTQAGGWLCGDVMSEAVEAAEAALAA